MTKNKIFLHKSLTQYSLNALIFADGEKNENGSL